MREYSDTASAQRPSGLPDPAQSKHPSGRWMRFWLYFGLLIVITAAGCALYSYHEINTFLKIVKSAESTKVRLAVGSVSLDIRNLVSDMAMLSSHLELKKYLENQNEYSRADLQEEFMRLCEAKKTYDQVRLLDLKGQELIRINNTPKGPQPVARSELQNKNHRYYFMESVKLSRGQCYISPFDLNIENKKVEIPYKPMIRIGAPVFNVSGEKKGVLVLNYLGQETLNHFAALDSGDGGRLMLLNQQGYWLHGTEPHELWGFMFKDKKELTFAERYPDSWAKTLGSQKGEYLGPEGFISYQVFEPQKAALKGSAESQPSDVWIIVSLLTKEKLNRAYLEIISPVIGTFGALLLALSLALWFMLHYRQNQKMAEDRIKRSEAKYRRLVENLPQGYFFYTHDTDGVFSYVSPSVSEILGYSQADFMRHYEDYLTDEPINRKVVQYTEASIGGEQQAPYELEIHHSDGSKRWLEVVEFPVFDQDGTVLGVDGIAHDLSLHRQTMEDLRQTRDFLNSLLEIAPMPIFVRNLDGTFRLVNTAWEKITGLQRNEVKGLHFSELFSETWSERVEKNDQKVVHTQKPQNFIQEVLREQEKRQYLTTVFPLFDSDGLVEAVGGIAIDITENLLNQERLRESEKRFRELADLLPTIVAELDENLIITYFNREGMSKFALSQEDIEKGLHAAELVHPDDHKKMESHVAATREAIQMGQQEYRLLSKDGSQFIGVLLSQPILRKDSFHGYRVTVMDITQRISMEESLRASEKRYRRLYDAMRDGLAAVDLDGRIIEFKPVFQRHAGL
jgi:PAS domain S-box-containing protein